MEQTDRREERKRPRPRRLRYGRIALAVFLLILIVGGILFLIFRQRIAPDHTVVLRYGELEVSGSFSALVVRNERVVYTVSSGATAYKVNEGDLIEKGDVVLNITIDDTAAQVDRLSEDANIVITKRMLQSELDALRDGILIDIEHDRLTEASSKKAEYVAKKELLGKIGAETNAEESAKQTYVAKNEVSVYSSLRGIVSFSIDGLESAASISNIYTFDFSRLENIPSRVLLTKQRVASGEQIYKVVDDSNIFLAIKIPPDGKAETYTGAESYSIETDGAAISGTLHDSFAQGDSTICVIRLSEPFEGFFTKRILPCTISPKGYKGLIIPSTALTEVDGVRGVYRKGLSGLAEFVPVKVLKNEAGSAIIQNSRFYDSKNELVSTVEIGQVVVKNATDYKAGDPVE